MPEHPQPLPESLEAIAQADLILLGPGSLYTSIIPNLLVEGVAEAIARSRAMKILVMNILTQDGETESYTGADHVRALLHHGGPGIIDVCIANNAVLPEETLMPYRQEGVEPLRLDREGIEALGIAVREYPLALAGRYVRHDPDALASAIMEVYRQSRLA